MQQYIPHHAINAGQHLIPLGATRRLELTQAIGEFPITSTSRTREGSTETPSIRLEDTALSIRACSRNPLRRCIVCKSGTLTTAKGDPMILRIVTALLLLVATQAFGQPVQLITADEANLPATAGTLASRSITRGPGVKLVSPASVSGEFPLKVAFETRGGAKIDTASIKVEYVRGPGVDLTARLKSGMRASGIEIPSAAAPAGAHAIRVSVRDSEGRLGSADFTLTVK